MDMPSVQIHYFAKDEGNAVKSFTLVASKLSGMVMKSGYKDLQRFVGYHITEAIRICKEEGYEHHRL